MVEKFAKVLESHRKLGLVTHINPDGDAIGSQLAIRYWLEQQGIETLMFNDDRVPDNLHWLKDHHKIEVPSSTLLDQCDGFLFIDGNHPSRFGDMASWFEHTEKPIYLIDHHPDPFPDFFKEMLWDPGASSTSWLVYKLFELRGVEHITKDIAEALYCGIVTDTGSFRFESVTAETHFAIGNIIRLGDLRPSEIYDRIYNDKNLSHHRLLGMVLYNIRLLCNSQVATTHVTREMLSETDCSPYDLEGFVNYPLSIKGVVISVLFYERDERIKISMRGKSMMDLNQLARKFNGGGHFNAAGAWHSGPMKAAMEEVVSEITRELGKSN